MSATTAFKFTRRIVTKINRLLDAGLVGGLGKAEAGKGCVEAMICLALGLPHSDDPPCVSRALRSTKMTLNDAEWSSPMARANGMRKLAIAQLGTRDTLDDVEFTKKLAELTIRRMVPRALRIAAEIPANKSHADKLEAAAVTCERDGTYDAASYAANCAASYAANCAASYAANCAANCAASAANCAASYAANCAASAANCAASYAANSAACAASAARARDAELTFFADLVLEALIALKVPGVKWLKYCKPVPVETYQ